MVVLGAEGLVSCRFSGAFVIQCEKSGPCGINRGSYMILDA